MRALCASALLLCACLERITDSPPPLDVRFYQGASGGGQAQGVGDGNTLVPFAGYDGPWVTVSGQIVSEHQRPVDLDLWKVDPSAPGNREHLGKRPLAIPGPYSLDVPRGFGGLQIEAFHDLMADGPTDDDPFAMLLVEVGEEPLEDVDFLLEAGARQRHLPSPPAGETTADGEPRGPQGGPDHREAPPGAPGGSGHAHDPGAGPAQAPNPAPPSGGSDPFASHQGEKVVVAGTLVHEPADEAMDLDVFRSDPSGPGGRVFVGKYKVKAGPFRLQVPLEFGEITLEVFVDRAGDGPSADDPFAACPCNPLSLRDGDVGGLEILIP